MPTDPGSHHESDRDRDRDGDGERADRGGSKQKASSSSKTKDLSHVPCKFFKVGGCTAGSSCPFSHSAVEPGSQKETCTWFVKGNCKFGHKCALAHVLPGQSMAMDRKNKKAAQAAASGALGEKGGKLGSGARGGIKREAMSGVAASGNRLPLLAGGATAPTRIIGGSGSSSSARPPMNMPLKATISPSAPAPPLKDTDFTSFATLEEMEGVHPSIENSSQGEVLSSVDGISKSATSDTSDTAQKAPKPSPNAVPVSAPRPPVNSASNGFGPIGSPPINRPGQPTSTSRGNSGAFSPGTSPHAHTHINGVNISGSPSTKSNAGLLSTSPFSAPGSQSVFLSSSYSAGGGIAASLGSGLAMMGGRKGWGDSIDTEAAGGSNSFSGLLSAQLSSSVTQQRSTGTNGFGSRDEYDISIEYDEFGGVRNLHKSTKGAEIAVEDEDFEDFLPSSLNDLLTPEERSRRMSRSNSGQPPGVSHLTNALASGNIDPGSGPATGNNSSGFGHRYSRSVPAPTLLGDIKSIWADTSAPPLPSSPPTHRGTPSVGYGTRFDPYSSNVLGDEAGLSMSMGSAGTASSISMMSPSNASAAFLPGLHHHYFNAKAKQAQAQLGLGGIGRQTRGASNPLYPGPTAGGGAPSNSLANNYLQPPSGLGLPSSPSSSSAFHTHTHGNTQTTYQTTPSPFDLTQALHQHPQTARPIPSNVANQKSIADDPLLAPHLLSPNARALQAHAPGQSLPQGLAAGYSRIHALPPLTNIVSPPTSGPIVPGTSPGANAAMNNLSNEGPYGDWPTPNQSVMGTSGVAGLETMFSQLSYSAAARSGTANTPAAPPGLTRNVSGSRYNLQQQPQQPGGPLSPLRGPVVTRDDDDLFDMDK